MRQTVVCIACGDAGAFGNNTAAGCKKGIFCCCIAFLRDTILTITYYEDAAKSRKEQSFLLFYCLLFNSV